MKLKINLQSFEVTSLGLLHFDEVPGSTSNGQHAQLEGHVLASVSVCLPKAYISLLHPQTEPAAGHIDVAVCYEGEGAPTFHYYGMHARFVPTEHDGRQDQAWPTGGWSLLQTVLAIESFLEKEIGFPPMLRREIFRCLKTEGNEEFRPHMTSMAK
jgi:hypothetical protein